MTDVIEAARACVARGWQSVPAPRGRKGPATPGWQSRCWRPEDFGPTDNIGVIWGARSSNVIDVDLDCPEALALADACLPPTGAIFGRASNPRSHWLYVAPNTLYEAFADPIDGSMLVELRADGPNRGAHQTLIPPSVADGECRCWDTDSIEPAAFDAAKLRRRCAWLATLCLVMRYVSETSAHRPGYDIPGLLYAADQDLGRAAFAWLGLPDPDAPKYQLKRREDLTATEASLWELSAAIPNDNLAWDDWNAFGLAFFAASDGSEEGFLAFDRFSAQCGKYSGPETAARWRHYRRSPPSATGIGKLIKAARIAGWRPPKETERHNATR